MDLFKDLADYLEAEVVAARVAACFAVLVKKREPYDAAEARSDETNTNSQRIEELEPGMVEYLSEDEDISTVNPQRPGVTFDMFVERILRAIGASLGLPYELVCKDFSKTNYSSARAALLQAWRYFAMRQDFLARGLCQPVWELWTEEGYLTGELGFDDYYAMRDAYTAAKWIGPGYRHVDPPKEVKASRDAVDGNLSTLADECALQGRDWEEVLEQRAREEARRKELGLTAPAPVLPDGTEDDKQEADDDDEKPTEDE
jgi:lambda family phage portal protein